MPATVARDGRRPWPYGPAAAASLTAIGARADAVLVRRCSAALVALLALAFSAAGASAAPYAPAPGKVLHSGVGGYGPGAGA